MALETPTIYMFSVTFFFGRLLIFESLVRSCFLLSFRILSDYCRKHRPFSIFSQILRS